MKIIGHRGARGLAPENTLASINKALDHNVDMIEFDVRVTKDDIPVLHHDSKLKVNNQKLVIASHTLKELQTIHPDLPTLEEATQTISNKAEICVEVKRKVKVAPVISVLSKSQAKLYLASKSRPVLVALHNALPELPTIVIEPWSSIRARRRARELDTKFISMNQIGLWPFFIRAVSRGGYKLMTYTLNNPNKARRWEKAGLYGVITDFPDRVKK